MSQVPPPPPPPSGPPGPPGAGGPPPPPGGGFTPPPPGGGYTPPPSSGGGGVEAGEALSYSWSKFKPNAGNLIAIVLIVIVVNIAFSFIAGGAENFFLSFLLQLAGYVLGQVLAIGVCNAALIVTAGGTPTPGEVFKTDRLVDYIVMSLVSGFIVVLGLTLCVLPGIAAMILFYLAPFYVLDGRLSGVQAVKASYDAVRSNFGSVFLVLLLAFVLQFVGLLACVVGVLVTWPIATIMGAYTYRKLAGQPLAP